MGNNVPTDYLGYLHNNPNLTYIQKRFISNNTLLSHAPCYNPETDDQKMAASCHDTIIRLAYLNQQLDMGSLVLRQFKQCLTQAQLSAINSEDVADYHPLNCAKMNAKPYAYFDAGVLFLRKNGWFPFFNSRDNNFSNRQSIGIICVGRNCTVDNTTGVLQDTNPNTNGKSLVSTASSPSVCYDTSQSTSTQSTATGMISCLTNGTTPILRAETFKTAAADNDNKGDGNAKGCAVLSSSLGGGSTTTTTASVETSLIIAFVILGFGIVVTCLGWYLYTRYQKSDGVSKFRYDTAWHSAAPIDGNNKKRASVKFSESNPGVKMLRKSPSGTQSAKSSEVNQVSTRSSSRVTSIKRSKSPERSIRLESSDRIKSSKTSGRESTRDQMI